MTLLAIVAIHTAANEPPKVRQVMNKIHRNVGLMKCAKKLTREAKHRWKDEEGDYCDDITALLIMVCCSSLHA